jgi:hypothetical protein
VKLEFKDCSDLAKAYQGKYEGDDPYLRRISNEVKARRGEYKGFGTYLQRLNNEAKLSRSGQSMKHFPTTVFVVSVASIAAASIGLMAYFGKIKKKSR